MLTHQPYVPFSIQNVYYTFELIVKIWTFKLNMHINAELCQYTSGLTA